MKNIKFFLKKRKKKSNNMGCKLYKNFSEDKKQKLVKYKKKYYRTKRNAFL